MKPGHFCTNDIDAIIYLDLMDDYMEIYQLPLHKRQKAGYALKAKLESISRIHVLLHSTMPALWRVIEIEMRGVAQLRAARAGLAVQRYRLVAGTLPDTLAELVPPYIDAIPIDPFDGNELRYRKCGAGFVIYSIGEDLSDDEGVEKPKYEERKSHPNWDVTFIVER